MVFQDSPCAVAMSPDAQRQAEALDVQRANEERAKEREIARRKLEAEQEGDRRLALEANREQREKAQAESKRQAELALAEKPKLPAADSRPTCNDLYSYSRAKGHGWMDSVAIAKDGEDNGRCRKVK